MIEAPRSLDRQLAEIGDASEGGVYPPEQRQPVRAHARVLVHDQHLVEEAVDRGLELRQDLERRAVVALAQAGLDPALDIVEGPPQGPLVLLDEDRRIRLAVHPLALED